MPERAAFVQLVDDLREAIRDQALIADVPRAATEAIAKFMGAPATGDCVLELFFENARFVRRRVHLGPYGAKELTEVLERGT